MIQLLTYPLLYCPERRDFGAKETIREVARPWPFGRPASIDSAHHNIW